MTEPFVHIQDEFVPAGRAAVLISDLAIQRGYGIFDFFKTLDGRPVFLEDHLDRFFHSAEQLRLPLDKTREELRGIIDALMERNAIPDSGIKLTLTGGYSPDGYALAKPNLIITQQPLTAPITEDLSKPISLITYPHRRQMPGVKTIDYLMAIWLQPYIRENGADDVLYHGDGVIAECPRSNFFMVTAEGAVVTPGRHVLKGITRMKLLELGGGLGKVEERDIRLEELVTAKEAFITSTTKHVLPVVKIDDIVIGKGEAGDISRRLNKALYKLVKEPAKVSLQR